MKQREKRILILGASGQIGSTLLKYLKDSGYECFGTSSKENKEFTSLLLFDLQNNIEEIVDLKKFTHCIFCAAQTSILKCKEDPIGTKYTNVDRTIDAISKCVNYGIKVIFLSSDNVFAGKKPFYSIEDIPSPSTTYGLYKLLVEDYIKTYLASSCSVLRITKVISESTPLMKKWRDCANSNKPIYAFKDKYFAPIYIHDLVKVIEELIKNNCIGVYQFSGIINVSYLEFCRQYFSKDRNALDLIVGTDSGSENPHASLKIYLPNS